MAKHTAAHVGLLALLVLAAAAQVSADVAAEVAALEALESGVANLASGSRSDVASCWGSKLTCAYTAKCASSKCECCGCACATLQCFYNSVRSGYVQIQAGVNALKTAEQRRKVAPAICKLAQSKLIPQMVGLYKETRCPGYLTYIKNLNGFQANYNKWCRGFSG